MGLTASHISSLQDFTGLLIAWRKGDESALDRLTPLVYAELHRLAHIQMSRERNGHVLQTTALVNEAYLKLMDTSRMDWQNRTQFFAPAARRCGEFWWTLRGSGNFRNAKARQSESLLKRHWLYRNHALDLVALDDALNTLAKFDQRKSRVVELRFFGGLTVEETASAMKVSTDIVKRRLALGKDAVTERTERPTEPEKI